MSKEQNRKLLATLMNGEPEEVKPDAVVQQQVKPEEVKPDDDGEGLTIPVYQKAIEKPRKAPEDSIAALRKDRDEARRLLAEKTDLLEKSSKQGTIFDEVKKLINKDDVTPEDLKQIFDDYEFTKKEKAALEGSLKDAQTKLRDYDINNDPEYIANFIQPIHQNASALAAEIQPIINGEAVPVPKSAQNVMDELFSTGNINATAVKIALTKIKDAYEDADIEYEMPRVSVITEYLLKLRDAVSKKDAAFKDWENTKNEKVRDKEEDQKHRQGLVQTRSRQERRKMAQSFMESFVNREDFDYLAEAHGYENVMQAIADQHTKLTDMMDDPTKAPTYDALLEMYAKADLYDKLIEDKKAEMRIVVAKKDKAKIESVGQRTTTPAKSDDPVRQMMRESGISV